MNVYLQAFKNQVFSILTVVDKKVALQREGGTEQRFTLLTLKGPFLRVCLQGRVEQNQPFFNVQRELPTASVWPLRGLHKLILIDRHIIAVPK